MPGYYTVEGEEYAGEEADVMGAVRQIARAVASRSPAAARAMARALPAGSPGTPFSKPPLPAAPVQGNTSKLRSYMGFGFVTWGAADAADKVSIIEPQESFRGERLILDTTAAGGAPAGLSLLRRIDIGTMPQSPSVEAAAPAAMFRADATNTELDLQIAYRGTKMQITVGQTAAPGGAITVTMAIGCFGEWVR